MNHLRTVLAVVVVAILGVGAVGGQWLTANTINHQRAIICDQAVDIHNLAGEIRPVLVPSYRFLHLPASALTPLRPLPKDCGR